MYTFDKTNNMKRLFFGILTLTGTVAMAQNSSSLKLNKGQQIKVSTSMNMDMDLGMGTMKTDNNSNALITVLDEKGNDYVITFTVTKVKMSMDGMGQSMSFDSEKAEDANSEVGKSVSPKLNIPDTLLLNKTTGIAKPLHDDAPKEEKNALMAGLQGQNSGPSDAFLIIPAGKKTGDSWTDSITVKGLQTKRTYNWISSDKDIATIKVKGTMAGNVEQEVQGTPMTMSIEMNYNETRTVNSKTNLVLSVSNDADMKNTLDGMGMTMNSKILTNTTYSSN